VHKVWSDFTPPAGLVAVVMVATAVVLVVVVVMPRRCTLLLHRPLKLKDFQIANLVIPILE
jgi:hypothetical protein